MFSVFTYTISAVNGVRDGGFNYATCDAGMEKNDVEVMHCELCVCFIRCM
jgi:hypothetical protein